MARAQTQALRSILPYAPPSQFEYYTDAGSIAAAGALQNLPTDVFWEAFLGAFSNFDRGFTCMCF